MGKRSRAVRAGGHDAQHLHVRARSTISGGLEGPSFGRFEPSFPERPLQVFVRVLVYSRAEMRRAGTQRRGILPYLPCLPVCGLNGGLGVGICRLLPVGGAERACGLRCFCRDSRSFLFGFEVRFFEEVACAAKI